MEETRCRSLLQVVWVGPIRQGVGEFGQPSYLEPGRLGLIYLQVFIGGRIVFSLGEFDGLMTVQEVVHPRGGYAAAKTQFDEFGAREPFSWCRPVATDNQLPLVHDK